jgi:hypothetical protein
MSMESGSHPRLRTAYDREVMTGHAPWVPGGNPTPEESARQAAYDAGRPLVDPSVNTDPRDNLTGAHARSAYCRCGCGYPTANRNGYVQGHAPKATGWPLVDLSVNPDPSEYAEQVPTADGGVISAALAARGDQGWEADADRDSAMAARLAEHVRDMDASVAAWLADPSATVEEAERIMGIWQGIRKITRGEGGR